MDITQYLVLTSCILVTLGLLFRKRLLTVLGRALVVKKIKQFQSKLNLIEHHVELPNQTTAWYMERAVHGATDGPILVLLPGATVNMTFMGVRLIKLLESLPQRRVIIMENPHHGRNVSLELDFSKADTIMSIAEHLEQMRLAIGLNEPFDLLGYSLGGGVAAHYAVTYPDQVHRLLLLAPYFNETSSDGFKAQFDARTWRAIHGWESFEEMLHFFYHWLGLSPQDAPPQFVLRGLHALRAEVYPARYWSLFFEAVT